jgi:hypothetical protein
VAQQAQAEDHRMGGAVADHREASERNHLVALEALLQQVMGADVAALGHQVDLGDPDRALADADLLAAVVQVEPQRGDPEHPGDDRARMPRRSQPQRDPAPVGTLKTLGRVDADVEGDPVGA